MMPIPLIGTEGGTEDDIDVVEDGTEDGTEDGARVSSDYIFVIRTA